VSPTQQPIPLAPAALPRHSVGSTWLASVQARLSRLLCSDEVDRDPRLKIIAGCLLLYYHLTFYFWRQNAVPLSTAGDAVFDYVPAPFFQGLRGLVFLNQFQTETYLYVLGMLALLGLFSLFYLRSSLPALCLLAWLFVNKLYFYLGDFRLFTNYHHFHLLYTLTFLLAQDKLRFFRAVLGLSYLMSAVVKLSPSWLLGEYFNSVAGKLPLLPQANGVVLAASVGLIVLELFGPLCWFTRVRWLRRLSFGAFILFHLYSGVIVGFWYTTLMLPVVAAAFLEFDEPLQSGYRFLRRHLVVFALFALALLGSLYHYFIPGDVRLTAEGRYYGLFMFDANHSVRFVTQIRKGDKTWIIELHRRWNSPGATAAIDSSIHCEVFEAGRPLGGFPVTQPILDGGDVLFNPQYFNSARMRMYGDPYLYFHYARELVRRCRPDRVSIRLDQQLDGRREFVTLLEIPDFARLDPSYRAFSHNEWIQLPGPDSSPAYRWP